MTHSSSHYVKKRAFLQLAQTVLPTIYSLITLHLIYRFITKFICLTTSSVQPTKIGRFLQYQTIVTKFITSKSIPNAKVQNHWMGGYQLIHQYESRLATVALVVEWNVVPTHDGICTKLWHMNDLLHKLGKRGSCIDRWGFIRSKIKNWGYIKMPFFMKQIFIIYHLLIKELHN